MAGGHQRVACAVGGYADVVYLKEYHMAATICRTSGADSVAVWRAGVQGEQTDTGKREYTATMRCQ